MVFSIPSECFIDLMHWTLSILDFRNEETGHMAT